jgi:hypothetical protein
MGIVYSVRANFFLNIGLLHTRSQPLAEPPQFL